MTKLAIVSIILGIIFGVIRGIFLIFAPELSLENAKKMTKGRFSIRIAGIITALLSIVCIWSSWDVEKPGAFIILITGVLFALTAVFFLVFTSASLKFTEVFWEMSNLTARIFGLISLGFGVLLIYLGFYVF